MNIFQDHDQDSVNYTHISYLLLMIYSTCCPTYCRLHQTVVDIAAAAAYERINLEQHLGAHPRLSVVDDIVIHPPESPSLDEAAG